MCLTVGRSCLSAWRNSFPAFFYIYQSWSNDIFYFKLVIKIYFLLRKVVQWDIFLFLFDRWESIFANVNESFENNL